MRKTLYLAVILTLMVMVSLSAFGSAADVGTRDNTVAADAFNVASFDEVMQRSQDRSAFDRIVLVDTNPIARILALDWYRTAHRHRMTLFYSASEETAIAARDVKATQYARGNVARNGTINTKTKARVSIRSPSRC